MSLQQPELNHTIQTLTIAGSDSGGGAGIQADLKTFQMRGVYGCSVLTASTAQNTLGVHDIHALPTAHIQQQLHAIANDFEIRAYKIGMLGQADTIRTVADFLQQSPFGILVLDPVMVAKGGAKLLADDALNLLKQRLIPLADVITPNLVEAEHLTGIPIHHDDDIHQAGEILRNLGAKNVIIKGGHREQSQSKICRDWLFTADDCLYFDAPRYNTPHTHGTGCSFSACLTAELAKGHDIVNATQIAKDFISDAIRHPLNIGAGHGPVNHWAYQKC